MALSYKFDAHELSFVAGPKGLGLSVAVSPRYNEEEKLLTFFQPVHRQRAFVIKRVIKDEPDRLTFVDSDGRKITLRAMTLKLYREKVQPVVTDAKAFRSKSELIKHYTKTLFAS